MAKKNIEIPKDNNIINLSHINGPTRELGEIGMNLLIESLNNDSKKELNSIIITPELVLKGSEKLIK